MHAHPCVPTDACQTPCSGISQDDEIFPQHSRPLTTDLLVKLSKDCPLIFRGCNNRTFFLLRVTENSKGQARHDRCWTLAVIRIVEGCCNFRAAMAATGDLQSQVHEHRQTVPCISKCPIHIGVSN